MVVTPGTEIPQATPGTDQQPVQPQAPPQPTAAPETPAPPQNPYDFIMNPEKPKKKPIPLALPGGGNSLLSRIAIAGGGLLILIILIVIVSSLISSGGKEKTVNLLTVAQDQTEIIRVATVAAPLTTSIPAQNLAQDILATVTSDNGTLLTYMKVNGQKTTEVQLALKHSTTTDTTLTGAQQNNTYDSAFQDIMQTDLTSYMSALQKAYKDSPGPKGKSLLSAQYDAADQLLKLSKQ
jgi:hypothetical protein